MHSNGDSGGARLGGNSSSIGTMSAKARWFNPYPIEKYATD
jgi:hypothetical protein